MTNELKKLNIHQKIRDIDKAMEYLKTLPLSVDNRMNRNSLLSCKTILTGFLSQIIEDEVNDFIRQEIQGEINE